MWEIHTEQPEEQNQNSPEELYFKDMIKEKKHNSFSPLLPWNYSWIITTTAFSFRIWALLTSACISV